MLPATKQAQIVRHAAHLQRWGTPALLFSWLPLVGDALCVAAGWLRLHWLVNSQKEAELEIEGRPQETGAASRRFLVRATLARERIEGSLQDVTEKSRATAHLEFLAQHDPLTKALNRRGTDVSVFCRGANSRRQHFKSARRAVIGVSARAGTFEALHIA